MFDYGRGARGGGHLEERAWGEFHDQVGGGEGGAACARVVL